MKQLEIWFSKNHSSTGFDCSAIGFHNYLKKYHPELFKT